MPFDTISRTRPSICAFTSDELPARQPAMGVEIFVARPLHHVVGERGYRRLLVPANRLEVVAHELLVEARLRAARTPLVGGPETRGVGRHHLVDENELLARCDAELELGVGEDDAARLGMR